MYGKIKVTKPRPVSTHFKKQASKSIGSPALSSLSDTTDAPKEAGPKSGDEEIDLKSGQPIVFPLSQIIDETVLLSPIHSPAQQKF